MTKLCLTVLVLVSFSCSCRFIFSCEIPEVANRARTELPLGTSRDRVIEFLEKEGLAYRDDTVILKTTSMGDEFTEIMVLIEGPGGSRQERVSLGFYFNKSSNELAHYRVAGPDTCIF
jgi:hypothetical protein